MDTTKKFYWLMLSICVLAGLMLTVVFNRGKNIQTQTVNTPLISAGFQEFDYYSTGMPPIGNPGAALIAVGWFDFNNARDRDVLKNLLAVATTRPQDIQLYIKNFPQPKLFHSDSALPHRALWCASKQNQLRTFLENGILSGDKLDKNSLQQTADVLGINQTTWNDCLNLPITNQIILDDFDQAERLGLKSTPSLFVNNKKINLEDDVDIKELFDKLLAV